MKIKLLLILAFFTILTFFACSGVDINDETAVMKDIQGNWVGYAQSGDIYRHIKVSIKENRFDGWLQTTDSAAEPEWAVLPTETGTISISAVQERESRKGNYRSLNFAMQGRCCTDNSFTARLLSEFIIYSEKQGLSIEKGMLIRIPNN